MQWSEHPTRCPLSNVSSSSFAAAADPSTWAPSTVESLLYVNRTSEVTIRLNTSILLMDYQPFQWLLILQSLQRHQHQLRTRCVYKWQTLFRFILPHSNSVLNRPNKTSMFETVQTAGFQNIAIIRVYLANTKQEPQMFLCYHWHSELGNTKNLLIKIQNWPLPYISFLEISFPCNTTSQQLRFFVINSLNIVFDRHYLKPTYFQ